jgi:hypothetical protein
MPRMSLLFVCLYLGVVIREGLCKHTHTHTHTHTHSQGELIGKVVSGNTAQVGEEAEVLSDK